MTTSPESPAPALAPSDPGAPQAQAAPGFAALGLAPAVVANLNQLGYVAMTPIQAAALPPALAGRDLIAQARTGSGKTAAYGLPLLTRLQPATLTVQALVLCPTRELAEQVTQELRRLGRFVDNLKILCLCGGSPLAPQADSLEHGVHVVVGTPGRLLDHLERGSLDLARVATLVLDEADRMLDMGFFDAIAQVVERCPSQRQTLLFSATYPEGIAQLAGRFLRQPETVKAEESPAGGQIRQRFYEIKHEERFAAVVTLLRHFRPVSTLAFCNTKQQCRDLRDYLYQADIDALTLNGDLEQRDRDQVLIRFANRSCSVLVATDLAARGLDIDQLEAVINVDVTPDPEIYVHRIGRTGRGDRDGWAFSLVSPRDKRRVADIAQFTGMEPEWHGLGELQSHNDSPLRAPMATLLILGGRKDKLRAGDLLGALTGTVGLGKEQVGKITVTDQTSYVAVARPQAREALRRLTAGKVKGRKIKARLLED